MDDEFRETFWETVCGLPVLGLDALVLSFTMLVLLGLSLPFTEPGSATRVVGVMGLVVSLFVVLISLGIQYKCRQR